MLVVAVLPVLASMSVLASAPFEVVMLVVLLVVLLVLVSAMVEARSAQVSVPPRLLKI